MRPEVISGLLAALGIFGSYLAAILTRRGKTEDLKLQRADQAFDHMKELAETRSVDLVRATADRDAAWAEVERVRKLWEGRWDRQILRCRKVTAALVETIAMLRTDADPKQRQVVEDALHALDEHNDAHDD